VADTADPLAGSYYVEALTDELETLATDLIDRIEDMGGAVRAIEDGWMQGQIEDSAYAEARRQSDGSSVVVGMTRYTLGEEEPIPVLEVDAQLERDQIARTVRWRQQRDQADVDALLEQVEKAAKSEDNLLYPMKEALEAGATIGEVSDALRSVFGAHRPS
jgi:methylmalonyl-CoA mutase N-terminal domain/subunit